MAPEVVNKNKNCVFNGPYAGRDLYITMYQDNEREFVVTHNADIKPVTYFTGREKELDDLRQRIEEGRKSVLVSGMGGIGKTHICRKLFEEYLNKHAEDEGGSFRHIGYIEYNGDMGSSLISCLKFKQQESPGQNQEAVWRELEYLASDGKLLLFVDNVDKPLSSDTGLQRLKSIPGAIVLTSRQVSFGDEFEPYRIGFLGMEQCKEIYEKIRFRDSGKKVKPEEVSDLEYIIESLAGMHTITVELLAHLARTKPWSVKRLREELESKKFRLQFHKDGKLVNIQESYEVLYDLSELMETEQNILEAFSVFPYIPLDAETCSQWLLSDAGVSEDEDILMGLYQKGWLQFDMEQESYGLHPVFAQFIYEKCKPTAEKHLGLIEACQKCLEIPESGSAIECQKFIPFAESILEKVLMSNDMKKAIFIDVLAMLLQYITEDKRSEKWFNKSLEIYENVYGENHPETARSYNNLACQYLYHREYDKAEKLFKKSLKIIEDFFGENHLNAAGIYNNLAWIYNDQGEHDKAEKLFERSLKIIEDFIGENHNTIDIARNYNNLGYVYKTQGTFEIAEEMYKKSLNIRKSVLGEDHPNTSTCYNNLAVLYDLKGEYTKALSYFYKVYKSLVSTKGLKYPKTQVIYKSMEITYFEWKPEGNFEQWLDEKMKEEE